MELNNQSNFSQFFVSDRLMPFYNLESLRTIFLTADIDWAPDFAVESLIELVSSFNFKMTVFATHNSTFLKNKIENLEVGLHPDNTRPDKEFIFNNKIDFLKNIYPEAVGLRCHRNFFGNNIGDLAVKAGLKYDVTHLSWLQPFCTGFRDYNNMLRMSYFWEDGIHCDTNTKFDVNEIKLFLPGLKILNVHPILIYLNAPNDLYRREITKKYSDLTAASYIDLKENIYKGYGIKSFYVDLLNFLKTNNVKTFLLNEII